MHGTGVLLVHASEPSPEALLPFVSREPVAAWAHDLLARTASRLRERHADLPVAPDYSPPPDPVTGLMAAAEEAGLLVFGSRALGEVAGYLVGSVGTTVAGRVECPVVLVRARDGAEPDGPVVVGVDMRRPLGPILEFAFLEASLHRTGLHVLYAQQLPLLGNLGPAVVPDVRVAVAPEVRHSLDEALSSWRAKYPDVPATGDVVLGSAGRELVRAAEDAPLLMVGRRIRRSSVGASLGNVAHAVLHHSRAPVASCRTTDSRPRSKVRTEGHGAVRLRADHAPELSVRPRSFHGGERRTAPPTRGHPPARGTSPGTGHARPGAARPPDRTPAEPYDQRPPRGCSGPAHGRPGHPHTGGRPPTKPSVLLLAMQVSSRNV
ncbi:universal stress protein [Streptomyces sp. NPDC014746]|uniref:universal stress protein n=1 Tax=Streptomyces sp. NPDC014746 TaxID=3364904 RepID=UPI003702F088